MIYCVHKGIVIGFRVAISTSVYCPCYKVCVTCQIYSLCPKMTSFFCPPYIYLYKATKTRMSLIFFKHQCICLQLFQIPMHIFLT
uniref:Uncharacterized protein n=1 Tax=Oryza brachyantha TaxID=4533 RepID=J3MKW3_ORYBR